MSIDFFHLFPAIHLTRGLTVHVLFFAQRIQSSFLRNWLKRFLHFFLFMQTFPKEKQEISLQISLWRYNNLIYLKERW